MPATGFATKNFRDEARPTMSIPGFYWLIEDALAGCSRPGQRRANRSSHAPEAGPLPQAGAEAALAADLHWLSGRGIGAVLSLTETPLSAAAFDRSGLTGLHLPVEDLHPPSPDQLHRAIDFIDLQRSLGRAVAVHCLVGQGRTGTVLAAYLIRNGAGVDEALARVRAVCPGAIGSSSQVEALRKFGARREWIL